MAGSYLAKTTGTEKGWELPEEVDEKLENEVVTNVIAIVNSLGETSTKLCDLPLHIPPPMDGSSGSW